MTTTTAAITEPEGLIARYREIRTLTETLAAPLSAEDQTVQSMPDTSPTKWHRAHTTWFFETFCLVELDGYKVFDDSYSYLFNSYYEGVGNRHPRPTRGMLTRPGIAEVSDYRAHVDSAMERLLLDAVADRADLRDLVELGLHHEQQHQELMLMDIKHVLGLSVLHPAYREGVRPLPAPHHKRPVGWSSFDGGLVDVGVSEPGFHFDNEGPTHQQLLRPYDVANRLVTNGEWLDFMGDGSYSTADLWLFEGWHSVQTNGWQSPLYWERRNDGWWTHTLNGFVPVDPNEPVCHVSYYEADAFARWAGARLPSEAEWENASADVPIAGNLLPSQNLHPMATDTTGLSQMFGDVWEWTASPYLPYPGFVTAAGAVGEYNGKFMVNQYVLRGGCAVTPGEHVRATYRNFFHPGDRWMFGGLRLARDS